ncbi:hypothetical protein [Thermus tengchongensis]|uniref:Uncharacterized protein n=1 Tax=Thermus tengchongensis TaxID=1214928 RepID=A0A4Y9FDH0_9DEIN|nr:hypothetical protein [Thermus tengchongensis]TFU26168.1 hypothetical protein E0687_07190 [Thermus tengchongensis]
MTPEALIRYARANPGRTVEAVVRGSLGQTFRVRLRWEEGGVRFYIPAWRTYLDPKSEPLAREVMEAWRVLEARLVEGEDEPARTP